MGFSMYWDFMRRPEPISEITIACSPNIMVGNVLDVGGRLLMVTGIRHQIAGSATTTLEVTRPGWRWRARYRLKQGWRKVVSFFKTTWRRLRS